MELLTTRRLDTAREIAAELDQDNTKRREIEMEIFAQADQKTCSEIDFLTERAIVVCGEGWNPGVIGLAASRLVEKYKWPAILLAQDGGVCVGSARSIPGVDIHQAMNSCRDLFVRFGGHAQAAGLTIEAKNVPAFKRRLTQAILEQSKPEAFIPTEEYDLELELSDMTEELVRAFASMQPTGFGNPAPVFCVRGVHTTDVRTIGKEGAHLRMRLSSGSEMRNAIGFRMGDKANSMPEVIEAVVGLSINEWQDRRSVQCELRQIKAYMPAKAFLSECQRREDEIDAAVIGALAQDSESVSTERMTLEEAKQALASELLTAYQGTLLCVHSVSALKMLNIHLAIVHAQLDYAMHELDDIRSFNTLVMAPDWQKLNCHPTAIVALDGFMSDAERCCARRRFPNARVIEVTDMAAYRAQTAARLLCDDDGLRAVYRVLRQREKLEHTLSMIACEAGVTQSQALCALHVFRELNLLEFTTEPLTYRLYKSGKVSLEASRLRSRLLEMKG